MNKTHVKNTVKHQRESLIKKKKKIEPLNDIGFNYAKSFELLETVWIIPLICVNSWRKHDTKVKRKALFYTGQILLYLINFIIQCFIVYFINMVS